MPSLTCTNPPCRRSVPVPAEAQPGVAYACPHCGKALPPVPARPASDRFHTAGGLLLIVGLVLLAYSFALDTTAPVGHSSVSLSEYGIYLPDRVHNLGLLTNRICLTIAGACACLVGAIFLARPTGK